MEPFNSEELKKIFRNISCIALIGLKANGQYAWQEEEETRKDSSTVLALQEQLCMSELFKDIQDAILLILPFIMSDVQSVCFLSSVLDSYLEVKV